MIDFYSNCTSPTGVAYQLFRPGAMSIVAAVVLCFSLLSLLLPGCSGTAMDIDVPVDFSVVTYPMSGDDLMAMLRRMIRKDNYERLYDFVHYYHLSDMDEDIFLTAAYFGSEQILEMMWSQRKLRPMVDEQEALIRAAYGGQLETFQWLIANCRCWAERDMYYVLGIAIAHGHAHLVAHIINDHHIHSRACDYSFINTAMLDNQVYTIYILIMKHWTLPLDKFSDICAKGYLQLVRLIFDHQYHTIKRNHIIEAIHCCTRNKSFEVIRFLLKRFSSADIVGAIDDALEYAVERICDDSNLDMSYMDLVRILVYDGRAQFTHEILNWSGQKHVMHLFGLLHTNTLHYKSMHWMNFYDKPKFKDPSLQVPFECYESIVRWAVVKGDKKLAQRYLSVRARAAITELPSNGHWFHLVDNLVHVGQEGKLKEILRHLVISETRNITQGSYPGDLPLHDAVLLRNVYNKLCDMSQLCFERDFAELAFLVYRYSLHVLTMVGYLNIGLPVNEDVSTTILEEVLLK